MGGVSSTAFSSTESTLESINDIVSSTSQNCSSAVGGSQTINISGMRAPGCNVKIGGIEQNATLENKFECFQENSKQTELTNKIIKNIQDKVSAASDGGASILPSGEVSSSSTNITKSANKLINMIKNYSVAQCLSTTNMTQEFSALNNTFDCNALKIDLIRPLDEKIRILENIISTGGTLNLAQETLLNNWRNEKTIILQTEPPTISVENIQQNLILKATTKCVQKNQELSKAMSDFDETIIKETSATAKGADMTGIFIAIALIVFFILLILLLL